MRLMLRVTLIKHADSAADIQSAAVMEVENLGKGSQLVSCETHHHHNLKSNKNSLSISQNKNLNYDINFDEKK